MSSNRKKEIYIVPLISHFITACKTVISTQLNPRQDHINSSTSPRYTVFALGEIVGVVWIIFSESSLSGAAGAALESDQHMPV